MEDVARVDVVPAHGAVAGSAGHDADAGAMVRAPLVGEPASVYQFRVEEYRQVEPHDVALGNGEVVHHRRSGNSDLVGPCEAAGFVGDVVAQKWRPKDIAAEE